MSDLAKAKDKILELASRLEIAEAELRIINDTMYLITKDQKAAEDKNEQLEKQIEDLNESHNAEIEKYKQLLAQS